MRPIGCSLLILLLLVLGSAAASRDVLYVSAATQRSQPRLPIALLHESADQRPSIRVTFPPDHSYWQVAPHSFNLHKFSLRFETRGFQIPRDGFLVITGVRILGEYVHVHPLTVVDLGGLEPGSQFWSFQLWKWGRFRHELVAQTSLHIEIVVPQIQPAPYWMHTLTPRERQPLVIANLPVTLALRNRSSRSSEQVGPLPVCFVTGASSVVDGQKMIWLRIMRELSQRPDRYKLAVKTFENVNEQAPWVLPVRALGVDIDGQPLLVNAEDAVRYNVTVNGQTSDAVMLASIEQAFPELLNASVTQGALWPEIDNSYHRLDAIQPPFMAAVWKKMINNLRSCRGGVLSFANSRTVNDRVTLYTARLAGVRAVVVELPNLYPMPIAVDALLAPSHFALNHPSVASARAIARRSYVCNGGVDVDLFSPASLFSQEEPRRSSTAQFIVGYVGRLATEKSVGMLVEAAKYLAQDCSVCRILIIGDGPLKPELKELAAAWRVFPGIVEFVDGIFHDQKAIVAQLRQMHVYASTCMFETLGLAPLEAMSVGVPVVGFASGGVGEYLHDGYNGVAVQEPTPQALSQAILSLYKNETLRRVLGANARRTVVQRFSQQQGIQKYADLYDRLGRD